MDAENEGGGCAVSTNDATAGVARGPFGHNGRIAHIDLSAGRVEVEEPGEDFYRRYLGGGALGAFYLLRDMRAGADALGPDNVLVFAPSVLTGAPITGLSRFSVTAKSPLTGAIGASECGGHFGPQLKYAGFDALVVKGAARRPVYLWIRDGEVELRKASHLAGLFPKETEAAVRDELGDARVEILQNGPAGRRLVRFACVGNRLRHFAGRTGMGAVMGVKNLVAIAARGKRTYAYFDEVAVKEIAGRAKAAYDAAGYAEFTDVGTSSGVELNRDVGGLPTRNMSRGEFAGADKVDSTAYHAALVQRPDTCFACIVRCKRVLAGGGDYRIDAAYGGPEYETIGMLGPNCGVADIAAIAKANELCDAYGLDTIQTGALIAFAMECAEHGLIPAALLDGFVPAAADKASCGHGALAEKTAGQVGPLGFGNAAAMVELVRRIGEREGLGDLLAEGFDAAVSAFGPGAERFAMHVKGLAIPAHMPQVKKTQALMYAVNPFGADHMSCEHDGFLDTCSVECQALDVHESRPWDVLDTPKARYVALTQSYYSMLDTLDLCAFCFAPGALWSYRDLEDMMVAITGFPGDLWYLLKAGERRVALMRAFNSREGIGPDADVLPERMFEPLPDGVAAGAHVDREALEAAKAAYYAVVGSERTSVAPMSARLLELDLGWVEGVRT